MAQPPTQAGMSLQHSKCVKYAVNGEVMARQGAMVAFRGNLQFEGRQGNDTIIGGTHGGSNEDSNRARYNGATLHFPATDGKPVELEWAGAHTGITFSPDGNFLVTTMQENALHGWKLADGKHMRMAGYPAKVKSLSWAVKGRWLASSGAPAAIVWPFQAKDGPMGKAPLELGTRGNSMVTAVACHPSQEVAAIGYDDGMVMAVRFADSKEVLLRRPGKGAVTSMMWDDEERRIAFGTETGDCGVIDITG